jgi:hypothetical protein
MSHFGIVLSISLVLMGCGKAQFSSNRIETSSDLKSVEANVAPAPENPSQTQSNASTPTPVRASVSTPTPQVIVHVPFVSEQPVTPPPPPPPKASTEECVRGKGLTIVYDQATDTYKEASGDFHVWYNYVRDDRKFPNAAFVATQSIENTPFVTAFVDGKIDSIKGNAHVGLKGLNRTASITNLVDNSHVALFAPMKVENVRNISHLDVFGKVDLGSIDCVSHLYIEHSNMAQFIGKTLYTSWVHIQR